ncbi:MAG: tRNA pseudouridine(38-40) synthase TruA [Clostridiales bacterium]|nr:tRNA pseudouridine(38-40) synthase TruA [Clostridiales bacterium]
MNRVLLFCEFDGSGFVGYQNQDNGRSVQGTLEKALSSIYKTDIKITGCSRTDAGVHASEHASSYDAPFVIPADRIPMALNAILPDDVAVKKAVYVADDISARFDTKGKTYCYRIYCSRTRSPLRSRYSYYSSFPCDVELMKQAAGAFAGTHDFAAFCAAGGSQITTVRKINSVTVERSADDPDMIEIRVTGEAFLYNMVRIIAGTLYYVGIGKIAPSEIPGIIDGLDRSRAGKTMPAKGLTLERVYYDIAGL